ncbi:MAG: hypothetical protein NWE86_04985 [Candidatus Bathyarchaeota archaeon]|nr:hypothetical protein [Candidatus Bathyarchaeota archaeon]
MSKSNSSKIFYIVLIFLIISIGINNGVTNTYARLPFDSNLGNWKTIHSFKGSRDAVTEKFMVTENYWRVKYTVRSLTEWQGPRALNFDIYVYSGTGKYIDMYDWDSTGTWFLYFEEEPGEFYVEIDANNIYYWKAEIQILE